MISNRQRPRLPGQLLHGRFLTGVLLGMTGAGAWCAEVDFQREVRPILAQHCFACHGPDPAARKAKLRPDQREFAAGQAEGGKKVIHPGDPDASPLVQRIESEDPDDRMPPPEAKPLSAAQKRILRRWVAAGEPYTEHWAFRVPQRAPFIKDLKRRGLLDETLLIWGGEFGRTPMVESNAALGRRLGRDYHPQAFTMWLAGGGIKPGLVYAETDELGFHVARNPVHVHDLQATILHVLGLDHERLTYHHAGRDFRLTDVHQSGA